MCPRACSSAEGEEVVCTGSQAWGKRPPVRAAGVPTSRSLATATAHVCMCPTENPRIHKLFSSSCLWCPTSASYWQNLTEREPGMCRFQTPRPSSKEQSTEGWVRGRGSTTSTQPTPLPILFKPMLMTVHAGGHVQGSGEEGGLGRQRTVALGLKESPRENSESRKWQYCSSDYGNPITEMTVK